MQSTEDLVEERNHSKSHQPVKQVRSHESQHSHRLDHPYGRYRKNRSLSAGFRHSIRNLTSCALARRKPTRGVSQNDQGLLSDEGSVAFDDDTDHRSSRSILISVRHSPSLTRTDPSSDSNPQSMINDIPPAIPPRKPLNKKSDIQIVGRLSAVKSTKSDDISLSNPQPLLNKEISTSLVNLMGTITDSIPMNNNTTQISTDEFRHTSAGTVDRLGLIGSSGNVGTSGLLTKSNNEYTWCYENSIGADLNFEESSPRLEVDDKPLIYRQQFEPTEHLNWYGLSDSQGPVIISYKYSNDQDKQRYIMAIVRTRQRTSIESLLDIPTSLSFIDILRRICEQCAINDIEYFDPVICEGTHDLLIKYDESYVSTKHKFGIIYQRECQSTEEDIFSNETHSIAMDRFLDLIGDRVKLKDFQGFRGGLDVKSDQTGIESLYEQYNNHEIMFHVSTLLPHSKIERQQLERKRHIGNDIVAIIFQETETSFNPECIASQFLHVYLVITPLDPQGTSFKVSVIHRDSVPKFGPILNPSYIFHCDNTFKQWLLTKLINAETASCRSISFQKYQERTKIHLFENLYRTLHENNRPWMNWIYHSSQYKHECDLEQQKEDMQMYSTMKNPDRHAESSLLGSVRRRLIAPKFRNQHSITPPPTATIVISTTGNQSNEAKSKTRSMTMDLKRSSSKESMTNNGKMISMFSLSRNHSPRTDKTHPNRSLLDPDNADSLLSPRKYGTLSPCPLTPSNSLNSSHESSLPTVEFDLNKSSTDDVDLDHQFSHDQLESLTKDDLIKYIIGLQQQYSMKFSHLDQIHLRTIKRLEMQLQQRNSIDREN